MENFQFSVVDTNGVFTKLSHYFLGLRKAIGQINLQAFSRIKLSAETGILLLSSQKHKQENSIQFKAEEKKLSCKT